MMMHVPLNNIQSADAIGIKQEFNIKQEPVPVAGLVEVSASADRNVRHVPDFNESDAECDFNKLTLNEAKIEMKKECDEKNEEEPKPNADFGEEAVDGQQNHQPSPEGENDSLKPDSDNNAHSTYSGGGDTLKEQRKHHQCDYCGYSAQCKSQLDRHLLKHTGEKPHGCNICSKRFTTKQNLIAHMKVHIEEFLFHCPGCLQGFDGEEEKVAHEINCKIRRYECHLCKESFGSKKQSLMNHMRVHRGDKPFDCKECSKQFTTECNLNRHMKLHAGPRSFRCSKCHQSFSQQDERNVHEEKCTRHAFECDICSKTFDLNKHNLIHHMRTHTGEKPFQCKECSKKLTSKTQLKRHMKIHTKKLQFKCLICRQGFSKDGKRKSHQRNCNGRYYECHLCKKFFHKEKDKLKGHMHIHSGEKAFQCELCCNTFTLKGSLKRHMKDIHHKKY